MFHKSVGRAALRGATTLVGSTESRPTGLQFLRDLLEHVALDDVAHLIFAKISQFNPAFEAGTHFFHIVLKPAQSREAAIVNWLAPPQHPRPCRAGNPPIGDKA